MIQALRSRQKQFSTNNDNVERAKAIGAMVRPFHPGDIDGFLKKFEFETLLDIKGIRYEDCAESESYAKVANASNKIVKILLSEHDDETKIRSIIPILNSLQQFPRYDEPNKDACP